MSASGARASAPKSQHSGAARRAASTTHATAKPAADSALPLYLDEQPRLRLSQLLPPPPPKQQPEPAPAEEAARDDAPSSVDAALSAEAQPLDATTRSFMESRFGRDFGRVRLHTDARAAASARALHAAAYTVGQDITLGEGKFRPDTTAGKRLLAHELAHTIQQSGDINPPHHSPATEETAEREADTAANAVAQGGFAGEIGVPAPNALQRSPDDEPGPPPPLVQTRTAMDVAREQVLNATRREELDQVLDALRAARAAHASRNVSRRLGVTLLGTSVSLAPAEVERLLLVATLRRNYLEMRRLIRAVSAQDLFAVYTALRRALQNPSAPTHLTSAGGLFTQVELPASLFRNQRAVSISLESGQLLRLVQLTESRARASRTEGMPTLEDQYRAMAVVMAPVAVAGAIAAGAIVVIAAWEILGAVGVAFGAIGGALETAETVAWLGAMRLAAAVAGPPAGLVVFRLAESGLAPILATVAVGTTIRLIERGGVHSPEDVVQLGGEAVLEYVMHGGPVRIRGRYDRNGIDIRFHATEEPQPHQPAQTNTSRRLPAPPTDCVYDEELGAYVPVSTASASTPAQLPAPTPQLPAPSRQPPAPTPSAPPSPAPPTPAPAQPPASQASAAPRVVVVSLADYRTEPNTSARPVAVASGSDITRPTILNAGPSAHAQVVPFNRPVASQSGSVPPPSPSGPSPAAAPTAAPTAPASTILAPTTAAQSVTCGRLAASQSGSDQPPADEPVAATTSATPAAPVSTPACSPAASPTTTTPTTTPAPEPPAPLPRAGIEGPSPGSILFEAGRVVYTGQAGSVRSPRLRDERRSIVRTFRRGQEVSVLRRGASFALTTQGRGSRMSLVRAIEWERAQQGRTTYLYIMRGRSPVTGRDYVLKVGNGTGSRFGDYAHLLGHPDVRRIHWTVEIIVLGATSPVPQEQGTQAGLQFTENRTRTCLRSPEQPLSWDHEGLRGLGHGFPQAAGYNPAEWHLDLQGDLRWVHTPPAAGAPTTPTRVGTQPYQHFVNALGGQAAALERLEPLRQQPGGLTRSLRALNRELRSRNWPFEPVNVNSINVWLSTMRYERFVEIMGGPAEALRRLEAVAQGPVGSGDALAALNSDLAARQWISPRVEPNTVGSWLTLLRQSTGAATTSAQRAQQREQQRQQRFQHFLEILGGQAVALQRLRQMSQRRGSLSRALQVINRALARRYPNDPPVNTNAVNSWMRILEELNRRPPPP